MVEDEIVIVHASNGLEHDPLWFKGLPLSSKNDENFANLYFLKRTASALWCKLYMLTGAEKHKWVRAIKSKHKAMRHSKIDPILKIDFLKTSKHSKN